MSSSSGSDWSDSGKMVPVDSRLVTVSSSEKAAPEFVDVAPETVNVAPETVEEAPESVEGPEPASTVLGVPPKPWEDEAARSLSHLTDEGVKSWGEKYLLMEKIRIPTCEERACCPPEGY